MNLFLENNNLLTKAQNGFRSKHSTIQTIFNYMSELVNIYSKEADSKAIYIDFKKAFDIVNHNLLIDKL